MEAHLGLPPAPQREDQGSLTFLVGCVAVQLLRRDLLQRLVSEHVLQLLGGQPQPRALLCALLLLLAHPRPGEQTPRVISSRASAKLLPGPKSCCGDTQS